MLYKHHNIFIIHESNLLTYYFQPPIGKRYSSSGPRMSMSLKSGRRSSSHPRGSVSSLGHSPSGSQSHLSVTPGYGRHDPAIPEGSVLSTLDSSGLTAHEEEDAEEQKGQFCKKFN